MRLIVLLVLFVIANFQVFGQYADRTKTDAVVKSEMTHAMHKSHHKSQVATLSDSIDINFHELNWTVFPGDYKIKGSVYTEFTVTNGSINNLYFDMHDSLIVDSVLYHGAAISSVRNNDSTVVIPLPNSLATGIHDSIEIYYHGRPQNAFFTRRHSSVPEVYTLSEPYGAPFWWPCKDGLNDKVDSVDINITTSLGNMAGSLGLLELVDTVGNEVTYHWKHRFPVTSYLISLAVTNYVEFTEYVHVGADSFPVLNYVYPEDLNYAQSQVPRIVSMFDIFDSLFIPYPFMAEKYGHAQTRIGGGMEHQTMSTMGYFDDDLMAHELAHQWFGDYVTCASWEELWLNEGFATFLTGLSRQFSGSAISWENWKGGKISSVTSEPDGSVFVTDTVNFGRLFSSRLTYDKGSMLLHMLRWKLGDDLFFSGVTNYLNDPKLKLGYVTNQDLISHLEATSSTDLTEFFDDWFYGEGFPTYTVTLAGTRPNYTVRISQTTSHASVDFYEMPVEIQFQGVALDTSFVFDNTVNNQWFDFTIDRDISLITVDPNSWLLMGRPQVILGTDDVEKARITPILYPQPAVDYVKIMNVNSSTNANQCKLFDVAGNQLSADFTSIGTEWVLNIKDFPAGMYFIVHSDWDKPLKFVK